MRYWRTCQITDVPQETKLIVSQMVAEVAQIDPNFLKEFDSDPLPLEETPEYQALTSLGRKINQIDPAAAKRFIKEFDDPLEDCQSRLMAWTVTTPQVIGDSVRGVLGATIKEISDEEAIAHVLDPNYNRLLGDVLNLTTMSKLSRVLNHVTYVFRKRISHTADSQDQRHRMVPADRPFLATHYSGEPDYITPVLIEQNPKALAIYKEIMKKTFATINQLLEMGVKPEHALYRLPNSFPIRFTESGSLLYLHHKYSARLCYTAQEEIWRVSREEAQQINQLHPSIGQWLLAPCGQRMAAHVSPFCPEGKRYCGQPIWKEKGILEYPDRLI